MSNKQSLLTKLYLASFPIIANAWILIVYLKSWLNSNDSRIKERIGITDLRRPEGVVIWCHAVSLGESLAILPLINAFVRNKNINVLITSSTLSSAKLITKRMPEKSIHQFSPLDHPKWISNFLNHWKPNVSIRVESEIWPNTLKTLYEKKIPIILVNGKISKRSYNNWKKYPYFANSIFNTISLVLAKSEEEAEKFKVLGADKVISIGELKHASPTLPINNDLREELKKKITGRPVWIAASIHKGEEKFVINSHIYLKKIWPDILTVIAPRHLEFSKNIEKLSKRLRLNCIRKSSRRFPDEDSDIYILDTFGELGTLYSIIPIVFIGKSLGKKKGGQNPLEPAQLGCQIIFGNHMENFKKISKEMINKKIAMQIESQEELNFCLEHLLIKQNKQNNRENIKKKLSQIQEEGKKSIQKSYDEIMKYI